MPRTDLPRYSIGLTFSEDQLDRLDAMIEKYNATRQSADPMQTREQCIAGGLVALEALMFDMTGKRSVFEGAA